MGGYNDGCNRKFWVKKLSTGKKKIKDIVIISSVTRKRKRRTAYNNSRPISRAQ